MQSHHEGPCPARELCQRAAGPRRAAGWVRGALQRGKTAGARRARLPLLLAATAAPDMKAAERVCVLQLQYEWG